MSALSGCYFRRQFWDSLTARHQMLLSSPDAGECVVALSWDNEVAKYTKLQFFLGPDFDSCDDREILNTFELLNLHESTALAL
jgi:hypothetical protein